MIKKMGTMSKQNILKILATIGLSLIALTMTLPFLWMLSASFKVEVDVFKFPVEWIPRKWNIINNYMEVWSGRYSFPLFYFNSIKVTVLTTIAQVTVSAMGAYAFSKIRFKFRDALFLIYLSMMMIPDQVTIVPKFMVFKWLSLFDTHRGLILLGSFSIYGMFLLKQYMMSIPDSLSESARIDGAGHVKTFIKIILPMTKPALVTLMMLKFVWTWNDFQNPLVFLQSEELYTIQLGMTKFMTEYNSFYSLIMVAAVCSIIPLLIVFLIGQRYILEGMAMGAVKG